MENTTTINSLASMVEEQWANFLKLSFPNFQQGHLTTFIVTKKLNLFLKNIIRSTQTSE